MSSLDAVSGAGEDQGTNVKPANFLDIGGGASAEVMSNSLEIVLSDPQVESVLINVYGGITSCEQVAKGILEALDELGSSKPIVVRFDGNAAAEGLNILPSRTAPTCMSLRPWRKPHSRPHVSRPRRFAEMTLFIEDGAPVIVQGMTGHQGMTHTARMLKAGTNIVGGVNARKAGLDVTFPEAKNGEDATIHVFANCSEAIEATGAKASVVFVPPRFAKDAVVEAIEAGIELIVVITEGIPVADSAYFVELALRKGVRIVGPNCPGLLTLPSSKDAKGCNLGIIPDGIVSRGPLGLVSKSGTLTYQLMGELSDIGFTACLGAGGDPIVGTTLQEALEAFENDEATKAVVMIGEIGGSAEQDAAKWASEHMTKPVVAYIAGFTAPEGKQMGHAGAIVSGGKGTAQDKKEALEAVGIRVGRTPGQTAEIMREVLASQLIRVQRYDDEPEVLAERACRRGSVHVIYAVALGCYMALMLLVISMEEGGDNLSAFSVPLTEALVLLSQGIGFKTDVITLTIVPLLLTVLLIALIAQLARRFGTSLRMDSRPVWSFGKPLTSSSPEA